MALVLSCLMIMVTAVTNVNSAAKPGPVQLEQKVVPVISVGSGLRLGGALVTGPKARVQQVTAVAELDGKFGDAVRIRALVPVSTQNFMGNISRVPETSVIGLVNIGI